MSDITTIAELDEAALLHDLALNIYTREEVAVMYGMEESDLVALAEQPDFIRKIAVTRAELAAKGEDLEKRAGYVLTEYVIPTATRLVQSLDTTPEELVKLGTMLHKFSGSDRKVAAAGAMKVAPSINIFLGDDSPKSKLKTINPLKVQLDSDLDITDVEVLGDN